MDWSIKNYCLSLFLAYKIDDGDSITWWWCDLDDDEQTPSKLHDHKTINDHARKSLVSRNLVGIE